MQLKMTKKLPMLEPVLHSQYLRMKTLREVAPPILSSCLAMNFKVRRELIFLIYNFKTSLAKAFKQRKDYL
jgi:hypothetical protein